MLGFLAAVGVSCCGWGFVCVVLLFVVGCMLAINCTFLMFCGFVVGLLVFARVPSRLVWFVIRL